MSAEFLHRLFWACTDVNGITVGAELAELYHRLENAQKASQAFTQKLYASKLSKEEKNLLDDLSGSMIDAHEEQGFINGFRLGMMLAGELRGEDVYEH